MPKFQVTGDLEVAFVVEVEADSLAEAEALVEKMSYEDIESSGNVDTLTAGVVIDSSEEIEDQDDFPDDDEPDFEYHPGVDGPRGY